MIKKIFLIVLFLSLAGVASAATAGQLTYTPLEPLPGTVNGWGETQQLPALLSALFKLLITFGSLFAVVMLVIAGIGYMVSEAAVDIEKAKQRARAALWGLLLLTGCWLILYTINPDLLKFNLNIPMTPAAPSGTYAGGSSVPGGGTPPPIIQPSSQKALNASQLQAANDYFQKTYGGVFGGVLGTSVSSGQIFDRTDENSPENIAAKEKFDNDCQNNYNFGGRTKFISGDPIGLYNQDIQICYR